MSCSTINNQPVAPGTDVAEIAARLSAGRPILFTVSRGGESVRLTGRYAPTVLPATPTRCFRRSADSGRVDLVRAGNKVEATTSGRWRVHAAAVAGQFDLTRAGDGGGERADGLRRDGPRRIFRRCSSGPPATTTGRCCSRRNYTCQIQLAIRCNDDQHRDLPRAQSSRWVSPNELCATLAGYCS